MRRSTRAAVILFLLLLAGSMAAPAKAGKFRRLPEAVDVPIYAELSAELDGLPHVRHDVRVNEGDGRTVQLVLEEIGGGDPGELIVLIHGALSNRRTWRYVAGDLGRDHRLLLVDLLGSGESEKVDPRELGPRGYGPTRQARRVLQALQALNAGRDTPIRRITLVGHSLGGAVVLRMVGAAELRQEFPDLIETVDGIVLMSALDFSVERADPTFVKLVGLGRFKVGLAKMLGLLRKEAAGFSLNAYVDPRLATREDALKFVKVLGKRKNRRAAQAQIAQAVPMDLRSRRPDWERIEELVDDYRRVTMPCLIVWGSRDETLPLSMGYKLRAQLPDAELLVIRDTKHSVHLERPRLTSGIVRRFVAGGEIRPAYSSSAGQP